MDSTQISQTSTHKVKTTNSNRKSLLLIVAVFALPVILAKLALELQWLNLGVTNTGTLLTKTLTLQELGINDSTLKQQWLILYSLPTKCSSDCEKAMEVVHNTYVALGKEMPRVTPVALYQEAFSQSQLKELSKSQWQLLAMPLSAKKLFDSPQVYIVDPLGNVFLTHHIPTKSEQLPQFGKQIVADMKKLLKYSKVG